MKARFLVRSGILILLGSGMVVYSCDDSNDDGYGFSADAHRSVHQNMTAGDQAWMTGYFTVNGGLKGISVDRVADESSVTGKKETAKTRYPDAATHQVRLSFAWDRATCILISPRESGIDSTLYGQYTAVLPGSSQQRRLRSAYY